MQEVWRYLPSSLKTGTVSKYCRIFRSLSKGHSTCFHVMNSLTCFASSQNFCQKRKQKRCYILNSTVHPEHFLFLKDRQILLSSPRLGFCPAFERDLTRRLSVYLSFAFLFQIGMTSHSSTPVKLLLFVNVNSRP